ncbi:hypothetical protein DPMN_174941 [Dreissena polymorpha]|uniref:Uncharacterized protein n=1 Tax=Dreissena polymorpha TaxID=45954 RepID=A0A9D4E798_DREPO|nr:hypothetical protein DPMN_174941 [Dreissena polymorpha]
MIRLRRNVPRPSTANTTRAARGSWIRSWTLPARLQSTRSSLTDWFQPSCCVTGVLSLRQGSPSMTRSRSWRLPRSPQNRSLRRRD